LGDRVIVAVDAMGGDHAPSVVVEGALQAVALHDLSVALVGPTARLEAELGAFSAEMSPMMRKMRHSRNSSALRSRDIEGKARKSSS